MLIPDTPSQALNAPSHVTNTPSQVCQLKQQVRPILTRLFCLDAVFVANLRTFLAYILQTKKCGGIQKMTNMRYDHNTGNFWVIQ